MSSESDSSTAGRSRTPGRQVSRRQALLRRSTKGPLDSATAEDDPLSASTASVDEHESATASQEDVSRQEEAFVPEVAPTPEATTGNDATSAHEMTLLAVKNQANAKDPAITITERPAKNFGFLLKPSNFLPINLQEIPPPFHPPSVTSPQPLSTLLTTGHFLLAAQTSATYLTSEPDPTNSSRIFPLLYTRLACLQLLGLEVQAAQESKCLQDLNAPFYRDHSSSEDGRMQHVVPWDLRVLATRLEALGFGDWRRGIMAYYELAKECRINCKRPGIGDEERRVWKERLRDLGLRVGNALVEIGDLDGAVRHLKTLGGDGGVLRTRIALAFLLGGDVEGARGCLSDGEDKGGEGGTGMDERNRRTLEALITMADNDYVSAITQWQNLAETAQDSTDRAVALQNLGVCQVYIGEAARARETLQGLVDSHGHIGGITFNLTTVYELTSDRAREMKMRLAEMVAELEGASVGWDGVNADFKL